jgi:hypothetical protein
MMIEGRAWIRHACGPLRAIPPSFQPLTDTPAPLVVQLVARGILPAGSSRDGLQATVDAELQESIDELVRLTRGRAGGGGGRHSTGAARLGEATPEPPDLGDSIAELSRLADDLGAGGAATAEQLDGAERAQVRPAL